MLAVTKQVQGIEKKGWNDFSKYEYKPTLTIYKKGWFREHENEVVIMITDVMKPQQERHKYIFNIQFDINKL